MNRDDYIKEAERQLSNENFYKKVDEDLTIKHNKIIYDAVDELANRGKIHKDTAAYLKNSKPRMAALYLLPKIHKNKLPPPGRPIISANECPTERISQFVDFFLQSHLPKIKSYVRDTTDFIIKLIETGWKIHIIHIRCNKPLHQHSTLGRCYGSNKIFGSPQTTWCYTIQSKHKRFT